MLTRIKKGISLFFIACLIISQTACFSNNQKIRTPISKQGFYLDTICTISVYDLDESWEDVSGDELEKKVLALITDCFKECDRYEKLLSKTVEGSDVWKINHSNGEKIKVSAETLELLEKARHFEELSDGMFDITVGKATELWDFHQKNEGHQLPKDEELQKAIRHIDYKNIVIDKDEVHLTDSECQIDLGAIAKGYIADKATSFLEERGVKSAIIDLGGNIVAIGSKGKESFSIGIKDPLSSDGGLLGVVKCEDKTVVTSGTYERYVEVDGKKYHHILDPKTGYPVDTDILSVTVVTDKGSSADGDGLSTTFLTLGMEKSIEIANLREDISVIIAAKDGEIHFGGKELDFTESKF